MVNIAVTTSLGGQVLGQIAQDIACDLDIAYYPRESHSIDELLKTYDLEYLIVIETQRLIIQGKTTLFWHPNMSVPRIKALREGNNDPMISAMKLRSGHRVLDCTLGMAADAIVASFFVGNSGHVTGLEANKYIAMLVKYGLQEYLTENKYLKEAFSRLNIINTNFIDFMNTQPKSSYDIVYFDPMFTYPLAKSSALNALRPLAVHDDIALEHIHAAKKIAKERVVMKQNRRSRKFETLSPDFICGGRHSSVAFYVWEV